MKYMGKRFLLERCPVKYITFDIIEMFQRRKLANGVLTSTEQDLMPPPYLDAWIMASDESNAAQTAKLEGKAKE